MKSREERIDELLSKQEIRDLLARYCRGCDRCDEALMASAYHPDSVDNHGVFKGSGSEFAKWSTPIHHSYVATSHFILNSLIAVDGDTASGETYCLAWVRYRRPDDKLEDAIFGGRYLDRFERRESVWKIAQRTMLMDWHALLDTRGWEGQEFASSFLMGARGPEDPSYGFVDRET